MKIRKTSVFYQAMILTLSSAVLQVLYFIYRIIITRLSGAGGMGVYSLAAPYYSIISSIALSGITMAATRLSAEKNSSGNTAGTKIIISYCIKTFLALLSVAALVTFLFPNFIAGTLLGDIRARGAMLLFIPCLFFTGFENIYKSFFYGVKSVRPNIISEINEICVRILSVFILLTLNRPLTPEKTAYLMVLAMIISEIFSFIMLGLFYKNYQNNIPVTGYTNYASKKRALTEIAAIAIPISASSLLMNIISSVNTVLIPQRLIISGMTKNQAVETLGILMGMTAPLIMLPAIFVGPLVNVVLPRIAEAAKKRKTEEVHAKITKTIMVCSFLSFPAMGIVIGIGKPLCNLMYNNTQAGDYILPFALCSIFVCLQAVTGSILNGINLQRNLAVHNIIDGIIHIAFTYFLASNPAFGVYGFMLGHLASSFIGALLNTVLIIIKTKVRFNFLNWLVLPLIAGVYTGFMSYTIYIFCTGTGLSEIVSFIISAFLAGLIYIAVLELKNISLVRYLKGLSVNKAYKKV